MKKNALLSLFLIIIIFLFAIVPTYSAKLFQPAVKSSLKNFNMFNKQMKNIFRTNDKNLYTRKNKKFDVSKLEDLGKTLNIDFRKIIKKINEPYGSYWIDYALFKSISKLVSSLRLNMERINSNILLLNGISILLGIILLIIFGIFIFKDFYSGASNGIIPWMIHNVFTLIFSIAMWISLVIFVILHLHLIILFIKEPLTLGFDTSNYFTKVLNFRIFVIFLQIISLLIISFSIIYYRSSKYLKLMFIPIIIVFVSLFTQPKILYNNCERLQKENNVFMDENIRAEKSKILADIHQKSKLGKEIKDYQISDNFADYKIKNFQDSVVIFLEKNLNRKKGEN